MRYRKWTAECRFDNGTVKKIEILTAKEDVRLLADGTEIPRLEAGTPKSLYVEGATGSVSDTDFVFDLGGGFVSVRPNGKYRPIVTAVDGLARFTFGKTEILTVAVLGALFVGAILLAVLL